MSDLHLGPGSQQPARVDGKLRLYSMKYCPFSHRARLTLSFKKLPHDVVNINLTNKPEWYTQIHPEGKVPALVDTDGKIVTDSGAIVRYLDEKYPEPALTDPKTAERNAQLAERYDKIIKIFSSCIHKKDSTPLQEAVNEICEHLAEFEEELKKRGTTYFTGDKPGLLDILMWPFVERAKALPIIYKECFNFDKEKFSHMMNWIAAMKDQDFVRDNACCYEKFAQVVEASNAGVIDYDKF